MLDALLFASASAVLIVAALLWCAITGEWPWQSFMVLWRWTFGGHDG